MSRHLVDVIVGIALPSRRRLGRSCVEKYVVEAFLNIRGKLICDESLIVSRREKENIFKGE